MDCWRDPRLWSLTPEMVLKAEKELNEVPEKRAREIQALRDMVQDVPNLRAQLNDEFLIRFLRARKFNRDKAFKLVLKYYKIKASNPTILGDLIPSMSVDVVNANILSGLPYRDDQGRGIAIFQCARWDPSKFTLEAVVRGILFALEAAIVNENVQICGFVTILDLEHFGWRHLQHIRPSVVSKLIHLLQDSFPGRFKGFHLVRESVLVDIAYAVFLPIFNAKLRKRMHFHGYDMTSLHKHIAPTHLPTEFGGTRGPIDYSYWPKLLYDKDEHFKRLHPYGFTKDQ